jgi:predicted nucleic acid-binding protein
MYLVDANVFLEILLSQDKQLACKRFLDEADDALVISDFALHSIGVILFRNDVENSFQTFLGELLPNVSIVSLPEASYTELKAVKVQWGLDFDDAYQYAVAKEFELRFVTMDQHFNAVKKDIEVLFI